MQCFETHEVWAYRFGKATNSSLCYNEQLAFFRRKDRNHKRKKKIMASE